MGADFISGTLRKFLRGPRGAGMLYISDKALDRGLEPLFVDLRGAEWINEDEYKIQHRAKRFEDWETAYALQMGSSEAIRYALQLGIGNIESRNRLLVEKLKSELEKLSKVQLLDRGLKQCNIITFGLQGTTEEKVKEYFHRRKMNIYTVSKCNAVIDFAEKGVEWVVRVSPHYFNTENEIDAFVDALADFVK